MTILQTQRLISRPWEPADIEPFVAICADPEVMALMGGVRSLEETEAFVEYAIAKQQTFGTCFPPLILKETNELIGMVGLNEVTFEAAFTPAVEIGWRLARNHWGKGYITEMAAGHLRYGFNDMGCEEIVAFTVPQNTRSRSVMQRLGMTHDPARDFDHPRVGPENADLKRHVLYSLNRQGWLASAS